MSYTVKTKAKMCPICKHVSFARTKDLAIEATADHILAEHRDIAKPKGKRP
jgi:hypothetical protein